MALRILTAGDSTQVVLERWHSIPASEVSFAAPFVEADGPDSRIASAEAATHVTPISIHCLNEGGGERGVETISSIAHVASSSLLGFIGRGLNVLIIYIHLSTLLSSWQHL